MLNDGAANAEWTTSRRYVLERDGYACQICGHSVRSELDVHHRMPRSIRVDHSPANLITLCDACHASVHLNLQMGLAQSMIRRWALRMAKFLDRTGELPEDTSEIALALQALGKSALRPGQLDIILAVLRGENVLAVRPTGSGKSVCFQVPALLSPGTALVIEPLKALMKDQVKGLHQLHLPATFINGDLAPEERRLRYAHLKNGTWKFLYLAPERFDIETVRDPTEQERLSSFRPRFLVIDEAHSISQYGKGFRPSYANLGEIRQRLGFPQVLAFTATADAKTRNEILNSLGVPDATVIVESPDRPNIALARVHVGKDSPERFHIVARLLNEVKNGRAIIFVPTVRVGEAVKRGMAAVGVDLEFFHAKAETANWRDNVQGRFDGRIEPNIRSIIATSAFGMGLDIPDIRLIIHWQYPFSVEEYLQGFGRAGRDGKQSLAVLFRDPANDKGLLDFMVKRQEGDDQTDRRQDLEVIDLLVGDQRSCFRQGLLDRMAGVRTQRLTLAMRLLKWALEVRQKSRKSSSCCDVCDRSLADRVKAGSVAPLVGA
jgi:RecQ family ATP-dependent DNA helicase